MNIVATIEARMSSSRLPGKVLKPLAGKPMLQWLVERVRPARRIDRLVLATSVETSDDPTAELARQLGIDCFRGSLDDVLGRLTRCAETHAADLIVKLSGDNPLYHHLLLDDMVAAFERRPCDFLGTTFMSFSEAWQARRTFPLGLGVAVMPLAVLQEAERRSQTAEGRESVVRYIIDHPERFDLAAFDAVGPWAALNRPELRLTVDTAADFAVMEALFDALGRQAADFAITDAIAYLDAHPEVRALNRDIRQRHLAE
jgi:spore coat polysaccharide biosynthesis protein SpsF